MKTPLIKIIAGTLLLGTATMAAAQPATRAQSFATQFAQMQALSSTSPYTFKAAPVLPGQAQDPVGKESFADRFSRLQADSSNSSAFEPSPTLTARAADPVGRESFAETFSRMQADSSNSGEFKANAGGDVTAYANAGDATKGKPTVSQRFAQLLHRPAAAGQQSGTN